MAHPQTCCARSSGFLTQDQHPAACTQLHTSTVCQYLGATQLGLMGQKPGCRRARCAGAPPGKPVPSLAPPTPRQEGTITLLHVVSQESSPIIQTPSCPCSPRTLSGHARSQPSTLPHACLPTSSLLPSLKYLQLAEDRDDF